MPTQSNNNNDAISELIRTLQQDRRDVTSRLEEIDRKASNVPMQIDALRKELLQLFVTRSEYDPKHAILESRISKIEGAETDRQKLLEEFWNMKAQVRLNADDIDNLKDHQQGATSRWVGWIGVVIGVGSLLVTVLSHLQLH